MKDNQLFRIHADICRALTHPIRLEIVHHLRGGEISVTQLTQKLHVPQGTVSRHLSIMRAKGIVVPRREGTSVYYRLGSPRIITAYDEMHRFVREHLATQSDHLTVQSNSFPNDGINRDKSTR
jgi:ArsR family transcriptional regulator